MPLELQPKSPFQYEHLVSPKGSSSLMPPIAVRIDDFLLAPEALHDLASASFKVHLRLATFNDFWSLNAPGLLTIPLCL